MDIFFSEPARFAVFVLEICLTGGLILWMRASMSNKPEPWLFFLEIIFYGGIAALLSAFIELKYSINIPYLSQIAPQLVTKYGTWYDLINNISASCIEELAKYTVAVFTILNSRHVHKLSDAIIYLILIGLGFSLVEDIFYIFNPNVIAPYRLLSFYLHSGTCSVMGYSLGRYMSGLAKRQELVWAVAGAMGLHVAYNLATSLSDGPTSFYLTLLITLYITLQIFILFRKAIIEEYRLGHRFGKTTTQKLLNL